jgi:excinuclease UvrABC ATPase subunit
MKLYIPPQLKRLTLAFAIFISLFLVVRNMLVPATFGQYGHYRGASLADNADHEIHFASQKACLECHQDIEDLKLTDVHSNIRCETCHGPGQKHVTSGNAADIVKPGSREFCGNCHQKNAAKRLTTIVQIDLNVHNAGKNCIECHNPHQPWEMKE